MKTTLPIIIRSYEPADNHFICDSWARQLHESTPYSWIPSFIYFPCQLKLCNDLIQSAKTIVACLADDSDIIVGYATYEHIDNIPVIHWISVKKDFRQMGVGTALMDTLQPKWRDNIIIATQAGKLFSKLKTKYKIYFDNFILFKRSK